MCTSCAACKYLRKKCTQECIFAPYFPANNYEKYEAVHKVFGASHVARLLNEIHPSQREEAMNSLFFEAKVRLVDPINGCSRLINHLQRQLHELQARLAIEKNELASYNIIPYQQNHLHNTMMMPTTMANYGGCLTAQQSDREAQGFAFPQTAQTQQTPETQMQHNWISHDCSRQKDTIKAMKPNSDQS